MRAGIGDGERLAQVDRPGGVLVFAPATFQIQFAPVSDGTGQPDVTFWAATVLFVPAVPTEVIVT